MAVTVTGPPATASVPARILVVDDERSMREMLAILLKREGHDVAVAESGKAAIALLDERPFDLVVSDARMPDLDGLEVLRHARSINPSVIAIMVTAYGSPDLIRGVAQLGVNDYVEKPFNTEVLRFRIRKELDRRRLQQENGLLKADKTLVRNLEGALIPNAEGRQTKSVVSLVGDELKLSSTSASGEKSDAVYKR